MIELSNELLTVQVNPFGAELTSVRSASGTEYLWQAREPWNRHAPILFPIVGRLKEHRYTYRDKTYELNQHGFARDRMFDVVESSNDRVVFQLCPDEETRKCYPFEFVFEVIYELDNESLIQSFVVKNTSETQSLPASFGAHPAFHAAMGWRLVFDEDETVNSDILEGGVLTQEWRTGIVNGELELTPELFEQDALIFRNLNSRSVTLENAQGQSRVMVRFDEFPFLGIWAKPAAPFVCIEPWQGIADSWFSSGILEEKEGILNIGPGQEVLKTMSMAFYS